MQMGHSSVCLAHRACGDVSKTVWQPLLRPSAGLTYLARG
jgi:hypothetical protein